MIQVRACCGDCCPDPAGDVPPFRAGSGDVMDEAHEELRLAKTKAIGGGPVTVVRVSGGAGRLECSYSMGRRGRRAQGGEAAAGRGSGLAGGGPGGDGGGGEEGVDEGLRREAGGFGAHPEVLQQPRRQRLDCRRRRRAAADAVATSTMRSAARSAKRGGALHLSLA